MMSTFNTSNPSRCHHQQQQQQQQHHHHHLLILLVLALFSCTTAQNSNNSTPPSLAPNFNPSMAIIIGVLISAFFFMGFFSIYIRQCAGEGRSRDRSIRPATNETAAAGRSGSRAQRGLDPSVMETFPTFVYSVVKGLKIGNGALECAVCLNEFEDDETLRLLPKCDHVFHPECIDAWLVSHVTCPVCRANLTPDSSTTTNNACSDEEEHEEESETNENENEMSVSVGAEDEQDTQTQTQATATVQVYTNSSWIPIQNRPARSKSSARQRIMSSGKFPRSHSTGHSLQIQPGENCDRFTLRLPKHVRKQIILSRTRSTFPVVGDGSFSRRSSRRGYRGCGGGSSRRGGGKYYQMWKLDRSQSQIHSQRAKSDRWVFSMAPPFLSRTVSVNSEEEEGWVNSRNIFKTPNFDCSSLRVNGGCEATLSSSSSTRLPV